MLEICLFLSISKTISEKCRPFFAENKGDLFNQVMIISLDATRGNRSMQGAGVRSYSDAQDTQIEHLEKWEVVPEKVVN